MVSLWALSGLGKVGKWVLLNCTCTFLPMMSDKGKLFTLKNSRIFRFRCEHSFRTRISCLMMKASIIDFWSRSCFVTHSHECFHFLSQTLTIWWIVTHEPDGLAVIRSVAWLLFAGFPPFHRTCFSTGTVQEDLDSVFCAQWSEQASAVWCKRSQFESAGLWGLRRFRVGRCR